MTAAKSASKRNRRRNALRVLGLAGVSFVAGRRSIGIDFGNAHTSAEGHTASRNHSR